MINKKLLKKAAPVVVLCMLLGSIFESRAVFAEPQSSIRQQKETVSLAVSATSGESTSPTLIPPPSVMPTPTDTYITSAPTLPPASFGPLTPTPAPVPTATPVIIEEGSCGIEANYTLDEKGELTITGKGVVFEQAFRARKDIRSVVVKDKITGIDGAAFLDCRFLTSVTLQEPLQNIGDSAFSACEALTTVKLPSTLISIGAQAFFDTGLTTVTIPSGVMSIGIQGIARNPKLSTVKIEGTTARIGWGAFMDLAANTVIYAPANFSDTDGLKNAINGSTRIQYGDVGPTPSAIPVITMGPNVPLPPVFTQKPAQTPTPTPTTPVAPTFSPEPTIDPGATPDPGTEQIKLSKVVIKKAVSNKKKTIKVQWKKAENGDGYQVRFSTDKKFKKQEVMTVAGLKVTLKKLKEKAYYVAVRAYYVGSEGIVYGAWSKKKKVVVKTS